MPHQYVCVYRWFESDCQRVQKSLLLTSHIGLSAASHKLRCKASESNCQVVCLLVVVCQCSAGHGQGPGIHHQSKSQNLSACLYLPSNYSMSIFVCCMADWLGRAVLNTQRTLAAPPTPTPHITHHTQTRTPHLIHTKKGSAALY